MENKHYFYQMTSLSMASPTSDYVWLLWWGFPEWELSQRLAESFFDL